MRDEVVRYEYAIALFPPKERTVKDVLGSDGLTGKLSREVPFGAGPW
jgi:hypothetical protein